MHNLIDTFTLVPRRLTNGITQYVQNLKVEISVEFTLIEDIWKTFIRSRVQVALVKLPTKERLNLTSVLGLQRNADISVVSTKATNLVLETCIHIIKSLTSCNNEVDLRSKLMTSEIKIPTFIKEYCKLINSSNNVRKIVGTDSVLVPTKVVTEYVGFSDKESTDILVISTLRLNQVNEILNLFSTYNLSDFKELFYNSDFDLNISTDFKVDVKSGKYGAVKIFSQNDPHLNDLDLALLLLPKYKIDNNLVRYFKWDISNNEVNYLLTRGSESIIVNEDVSKFENVVLTDQITNPIRNDLNKTISNGDLLGKISKTNKDGIENKNIE